MFWHNNAIKVRLIILRMGNPIKPFFSNEKLHYGAIFHLSL
jgi:hypothetical protein